MDLATSLAGWKQGRNTKRHPPAQRVEKTIRDARELMLWRAEKHCWQFRRELFKDSAKEIASDPDEFLERNAVILKRGRSSTVGRSNQFVLKRYNFKKPLNLLKDCFRHSRGRRAFLNGYRLEQAGLPTARVVAVANERFLWFVNRSFVLMEYIRDSKDLEQWAGKRATAIVTVAALIGSMHDKGFYHRDLKTTNLLMSEDGLPYLIDLDGLFYRGVVGTKRARADLRTLDRSATQFMNLTLRQRLRFVVCYCRRRGLESRHFLNGGKAKPASQRRSRTEIDVCHENV